MRLRRSFCPRLTTLYATAALFSLGFAGCGGDSSTADDTSPGGAGSGAAGGVGSSGTAGVGATASGGGTSGSGGDDAFDMDDFVERLAKVRCDNLVRCYPTLGWTWEYECRAWMPARLRSRFFASIPALLEKGSVSYHPERVQQCLDDLATQECAAINATRLASCESIFEGSSAGECTSDFECASGHCCGGTCTDDATLGAACRRDEDCESSLVCSKNECSPRSTVGQPCNGDGCEYGLVCDKVREICEDPTGHTYGLDEDPAPSGAECTASTDMAFCPDWGFCRLSGGLLQTDNCIGASVCTMIRVPSEWICKELVDLGEECSNDAECVPLTRCTGTCDPLKENGAECARPWECLSNNCRESLCAPNDTCVETI